MYYKSVTLKKVDTPEIELNPYGKWLLIKEIFQINAEKISKIFGFRQLGSLWKK